MVNPDLCTVLHMLYVRGYENSAYLGQKETNLTNKDLRELTEPNLCELKKCTSMACFFKKEWIAWMGKRSESDVSAR